MGAYACGVSSGLDVVENSVKILVLGFTGSGKTFVVYSWSLGVKNVVKTLPTDAAMFNVERIPAPVSALPMYMWDISGKMVQRRRSYFLGTQGLVYVIDAVKGTVVDALADLESVLTDRDLCGLPLLVLVNKVSDDDGALSAREVKPQLQRHVHLPPRWAVCDVRMFSEQDLTSALLQLEELVCTTATPTKAVL